MRLARIIILVELRQQPVCGLQFLLLDKPEGVEQFNENAKVLAYSNSFPELNHNDTMALAQTYSKDKFYFMVFASERERIKRRISVTAEIASAQFNEIKTKGKTDFERMFYLLHYGDYVSYHLGRLRNVAPEDVSLIQRLKERMA